VFHINQFFFQLVEQDPSKFLHIKKVDAFGLSTSLLVNIHRIKKSVSYILIDFYI
jgi:hypothetical protein